MNEYALVSKNKVVNTVLWDSVSQYSPEPGSELIAIPEGVAVGIGWGYKNGDWIAPEPEPTNMTVQEVEAIRMHAYQNYADPLFFGWQRGENTEQAWLDAVQAVKDAHPYPETV